jgi:hypothetical protein
MLQAGMAEDLHRLEDLLNVERIATQVPPIFVRKEVHV